MIKRTILLLLLAGLTAWSTMARENPGNTPYAGITESDPGATGLSLCRRFLETGHRLYENKWIHEAEVAVWYGALRYAQTSKNREMLHRLTLRFDSIREKAPRLIPPPLHPQLNVTGSLPLLLYRITGTAAYLEQGLPFADSQWQLPAVNTLLQRHYVRQGYSWQTRMQLDDIFLIALLQTEAAQATGKDEYTDRAALQAAYYVDELQRPDGLFFQTPEVPFYWCRGNGRMLAALAELLKRLPATHPQRQKLLDGFRLAAEKLKEYQNMDGLWNQLPDRTDGWPEASGSAWITYALITGVKYGWLDRNEYRPVARNAWKALLTLVEANGDVRETAVETPPENNRPYYENRPRATGDFYGQAAYLWCVCALLEPEYR